MPSFKHKAVRLSPDVLFQEVEGEAVLLDLASGEYYELNAVGTRFWSAARETTSMDDIFQCILLDFEVEEETLEADLAVFVDEMAEAGLIELVDPDPPS